MKLESPLYGYLLASVYVVAVLGISIPTPDSIIQSSKPLANQSSTLILPNTSSANLTDDQFLGAKRPHAPRCFAQRYGRFPSKDGCFDAWNSISTDDSTSYCFGAQTAGHFEVPLPHRFLSCTEYS